MKKIFVSGCYDIIHAGHIQFFNEAKALGEHLTVCIASDDVLTLEKKRKPSLPTEHKKILIHALEMVDDVVVGQTLVKGLNFKEHFLRIKPHVLAVTEDDKYNKIKRELCAEIGSEYIVLPKTPPNTNQINTSKIISSIQAPQEVPLRVDFAGGWLDVPRFSKKGGLIVNCAIKPLVSLDKWEYKKKSGLGGSAAWAILNGEDGIKSEINLGVGWQDPAIIQETGLCVWNSGTKPELHLKRNGNMLKGVMALKYSNIEHDTPSIVDIKRNYHLIYKASQIACKAVINENLDQLADAVRISYEAQLDEGMNQLLEADNCIAQKYCGGGWGGYALYLFSSDADREKFIDHNTQVIPIEPFMNYCL